MDDSGSRTEYTYQAIEVKPEDAEISRQYWEDYFEFEETFEGMLEYSFANKYMDSPMNHYTFRLRDYWPNGGI